MFIFTRQQPISDMHISTNKSHALLLLNKVYSVLCIDIQSCSINPGHWTQGMSWWCRHISIHYLFLLYTSLHYMTPRILSLTFGRHLIRLVHSWQTRCAIPVNMDWRWHNIIWNIGDKFGKGTHWSVLDPPLRETQIYVVLTFCELTYIVSVCTHNTTGEKSVY